MMCVDRTSITNELKGPWHRGCSSARRRRVDVDVLATLRNHAEGDRAVHVPDGGGVRFWQLLDERHKEIQRAPKGSKEVDWTVRFALPTRKSPQAHIRDLPRSTGASASRPGWRLNRIGGGLAAPLRPD